MQKRLGVLALAAFILGVSCILGAVHLRYRKSMLLGMPLSLVPESDSQSCNCCAFAGCPCCQPSMHGATQSLVSKSAESQKSMLASLPSIDDVWYFTVDLSFHNLGALSEIVAEIWCLRHPNIQQGSQFSRIRFLLICQR